MERHKIIDLLADRETATLQKWLEEHPSVQIVSRDRYTNYSNAVGWQKKGMPIKSMARELGMSRNTVKKYLHLEEPPFRRSIGKAGLGLFDAYIRRRIKEQPRIKPIQLYEEIKQRGYKGARSTAYEHLHRYVHRPPGSAFTRLPDLFYVPSKVAFLLLRKPQRSNSKERRLVSSLCTRCPEIKTAWQGSSKK